MIEFKCQRCGERREENVLPGKHAILGTIRRIEENSTCCENPQYFDARGYKEGMINKNLRDMMPSRA